LLWIHDIMVTMKEILLFEAETKNLVWGNECWTISAHNHGDVKVKEGQYAGLTLSQLWEGHPELFGGVASPCFPLLIKIITANDDLSIQVHPDDEYAALNENGLSGKTECWYILDCEEDSRLIIGHNALDQTELNEMVESGRFTELIHEIPIQKGDFFLVKPGTIHTIRGGIRLLEIQQPSDITYRLYDYGRLINGEPRTLHLKQALDVIECPTPPISNFVITASKRTPNQIYEMVRCDYFTVWELPISGEYSFIQDHPFLVVCVIDGEGYINDRPIRSGDHFILPSGYGEVGFTGEMRLVMAVHGS